MEHEPNVLAKVLYKDPAGLFKFEARKGNSFQTTDPKLWGLPEKCEVIFVVQQASWMGAWMKGEPV